MRSDADSDVVVHDAFNSLSRDHVVFEGTIYERRKRPFNSLSRDHKKPEQTLYIPFPFANFQLPLSGSRARRTRGASSCKRQSFQLPLSGSLTQSTAKRE